MKVVGLISGGKDSCFNMMKCIDYGHEIVALANLIPKNKSNESDSFMYQSVGNEIIQLYSDCMNIPLFQREIKGSSIHVEMNYEIVLDDEVEDLFELLQRVKESIPDFKGVSVGAILSNYQRIRVENVCLRLNLVPLCYLWERDQIELLDEIIVSGMNCIIIKVAAMGLELKHLGQSLDIIQPHLLNMFNLYDLHPCGEGGEYETITLDCPLFKKKLVIDESSKIYSNALNKGVCIHSNDAFAPVAYLKINKIHLQDKPDFIPYTPKIPLDPFISFYPKITRPETIELNNQPSKLISNKEHNPIESKQEYKVQSSQKTNGDYLTITSIYPNDPLNPRSIEETTTQILNEITKTKTHHFSSYNYIKTNVILNDMNDFTKMNSIYKNYFKNSPPTRVCIESALSSFIQMKICVLLCKNCVQRNVHVQSISSWAPANIGPYSQVLQVDGIVYVSGQIGLIPWKMMLPTNEPIKTIETIKTIDSNEPSTTINSNQPNDSTTTNSLQSKHHEFITNICSQIELCSRNLSVLLNSFINVECMFIICYVSDIKIIEIVSFLMKQIYGDIYCLYLAGCGLPLGSCIEVEYFGYIDNVSVINNDNESVINDNQLLNNDNQVLESNVHLLNSQVYEKKTKRIKNTLYKWYKFKTQTNINTFLNETRDDYFGIIYYQRDAFCFNEMCELGSLFCVLCVPVELIFENSEFLMVYYGMQQIE